VTELKLDSKWYDDNLQLVKWSDSTKKVLASAFFKLRENIIGKLGPYCMNVKGRGGIKGSIRCIYNKIDQYPYAARFDIKSFYGSINHKILFKHLKNYKIDSCLMQIILDYITIPDTEHNGTGIVAGGALSTLLGAVYLATLDEAMNKLYKKGSVFYLHYVDDIVILAKTRWELKKSIKTMYNVLDALELKVHRHEKRFIGRTSAGFSFLGYFFKSGKKLRPSKESLQRFARRAGLLMELGGCKSKLLSYAERYLRYIHAGVKNSVSYKRLRKYIRFIDYKFGFNLTDEITLIC